MTKDYRFGRRLPLPSTVQILHELLVMAARDAAEQSGVEANRLAAVASQPARIDAVEPERLLA
jgi:hypothetical protein